MMCLLQEGSLLYMLQREPLKKMMKFKSWKGKKGNSKCVQIKRGETRIA